MNNDRHATPPGMLPSALRVFDISLGEMLWSRRTIFMALVVGLPVVLAMIVRTLDLAHGLRVNSAAVNGPAIFGLIIWGLFIRFIVPVLGVFYGTALIADEVEDKTITYLFTRPIPRGAVLMGKYLAYLACTVFVVLPSVMLVWLLIIPIGGSLGGNFIDVVKDLGLIAIGLAVYGAVFALVGAALKRPLLIGLLWAFGLEPALLLIPGYLKHLTVAYYLQGLVPQAMPSDSPASLVMAIFREIPTLSESLIALTIMEVGFLWLASRVVAGREYVLEQ
jgi:ABC-type transport system involved in multi-copper enzyme maturation permease subunit